MAQLTCRVPSGATSSGCLLQSSMAGRALVPHVYVGCGIRHGARRRKSVAVHAELPGAPQVEAAWTSFTTALNRVVSGFGSGDASNGSAADNQGLFGAKRVREEVIVIERSIEMPDTAPPSPTTPGTFLKDVKFVHPMMDLDPVSVRRAAKNRQTITVSVTAEDNRFDTAISKLPPSLQNLFTGPSRPWAIGGGILLLLVILWTAISRLFPRRKSSAGSLAEGTRTVTSGTVVSAPQTTPQGKGGDVKVTTFMPSGGKAAARSGEGEAVRTVESQEANPKVSMFYPSNEGQKKGTSAAADKPGGSQKEEGTPKVRVGANEASPKTTMFYPSEGQKQGTSTAAAADKPKPTQKEAETPKVKRVPNEASPETTMFYPSEGEKASPQGGSQNQGGGATAKDETVKVTTFMPSQQKDTAPPKKEPTGWARALAAKLKQEDEAQSSTADPNSPQPTGWARALAAKLKQADEAQSSTADPNSPQPTGWARALAAKLKQEDEAQSSTELSQPTGWAKALAAKLKQEDEAQPTAELQVAPAAVTAGLSSATVALAEEKAKGKQMQAGGSTREEAEAQTPGDCKKGGGAQQSGAGV